MKILYMNLPAAKEDSEASQFFKNAYVPLLHKNVELVKSPDTEVVYRFCEWGLTSQDPCNYAYMDYLASVGVYYATRNAEEEGFDAVVIDCFGDTMLWEMRQALNIPVVGIGEASMLLAESMANKFGIVHISSFNIPGQEERNERYGLTKRCVGIVPLSLTPTEQDQVLVDAGPAIEAFRRDCQPLIKAGAEILLPACSLIACAMRVGIGVEKEYPNGFNEVDGVPVADVIGSALKMAEVLASLKKGGSSWVSRKCTFARPTQLAIDNARMVTDDIKLKYWDVTM